MGAINLTNEKGRDAVVATESPTSPVRVRWVDPDGRQATTARLLRGTRACDLAALVAKAGSVDAVADAIIAGDPELDLEAYGQFLEMTSRVYVDPDGKILHRVAEWDVVRTPDGTEKSRRPREKSLGNTNTEIPLRWSGRFEKKSDVVRRYVLSSKVQILHVNGLTFDFLYAMAKDLEQRDALLHVGAGAKGQHPLVFHRGGTKYRGFLEGRTDGERYLLLLHLSNLELKRPPTEAP
jgi:hypothetical protein